MTPLHAQALLRVFDLRRDQDTPEQIERQISDGVDAAGTNLWVLVFAIFIASIGLNVNSTAVIIGAMLVSPLMGPIVGIGYATGVRDMALLRRALRSLATMAGVSLVTATLYFAITPLQEAQSELLARTSPTLWDVLIAFLGGAAGIVAITRKQFSNVLPGVAIATALMPPLCTTGYGIANGEWAFAAGAFYLFAINGVFIALATLAFVKLMRLPVRQPARVEGSARQRWMLAALLALMLVPSTFLAWRLVEAERFEGTARTIVRDYRDDDRVFLLTVDIDGRERRLALAITGAIDPETLRSELQRKLAARGQHEAEVQVRRAGLQGPAAAEAFVRTQQALVATPSATAADDLAAIERELAPLRERRDLETALLAELHAQFPEAPSLGVTTGQASGTAGSERPVLYVSLPIDGARDADLAARLQAGWARRFPGFAVSLVTPVTPTDATGPAAARGPEVPPPPTKPSASTPSQ